MKIMLNNRPEEFTQSELTVSQLLIEKNMTFRMRIVKINGILIEKDKYDLSTITDGDDVQVIYLMSGG
ncbi:MAG: sulfur carrier protein ThiS [Bacteroidales bacterium]|nr:sulfur carrier protein ThiS [Bacteroidales bacterium]